MKLVENFAKRSRRHPFYRSQWAAAASSASRMKKEKIRQNAIGKPDVGENTRWSQSHLIQSLYYRCKFLCASQRASLEAWHTPLGNLKRIGIGFPLVGFPFTYRSLKVSSPFGKPTLTSGLSCIMYYSVSESIFQLSQQKYFLVTVNTVKYIPKCSKIRI